MDNVFQEAAIAIERFFAINDEPCLLFNARGVLVLINAPGCQLFEFSTSSWQNQSFEELFCKPPGSLKREIQHHLRSHLVYSDEVLCISSSGQTISRQMKAAFVEAENPHSLLVTLRVPANISPEDSGLLKNLAIKVFSGKIATGVLHNVANLLNSVNVTAQNLMAVVRDADTNQLTRANNLFLENRTRIQHFIDEDPTGRYLPEFYEEFARVLEKDNRFICNELLELQENLNLIRELITTQQDYSRSVGGSGLLHLRSLIRDVLRIETISLDKHNINLELSIPDDLYLHTWRGKIMHVLLNLVKNAKEAILAGAKQERLLKIHAIGSENRVFIHIRDNGIGIKGEHLARMFAYGFTTRLDGHGFGLFTSLEAVREMKGELNVISDGPGTGAEFILNLPCARVEGGF